LIPCIRDGDFCLGEARAILCYLAEKYDHEECGWMPQRKCGWARSQVLSMLFFDQGTLFQAMYDAVGPVVFGEAANVEPERVGRLEKALDQLEAALERGNGHAVPSGRDTVADLSLLATYATISATGVLGDELSSRWPKADKWAARLASFVPNYEEACGSGAQEYGDYFRMRLRAKAAEVKKEEERTRRRSSKRFSFSK